MVAITRPAISQDYFSSVAHAAMQKELTTGVARGFEPVGELRTLVRLQGERDSLPVTAEPGWEYLALGVCDVDCSDLYFYLIDTAGTRVWADVWSGRRPQIRFKVRSETQYTLAVVVGKCSVPPCFYATQLFRKRLPA
jgi:hypothetical protein